MPWILLWCQNKSILIVSVGHWQCLRWIVDEIPWEGNKINIAISNLSIHGPVKWVLVTRSTILLCAITVMSQPVASCGGRPGGYHPWRSEVEGSHHLWCFRAFLPALVPPSWSTTSESQSRCHWWSHSENNSSKRCTRRKEADSKVNTTSLTTNFSRPWSFPPRYTTLASSTPSLLSRSWPHMTVVSNSPLPFHPCWQGTFMKYILHGIRSAQNVHISTHIALFLSRKKRNQKEIFIQMTVKISTNLLTCI